MTKPLAPRIPAPHTGEPSRPPVMITPRVALAAGASVALLAATFALAFQPAKVHLPATERVAASHYSVQMANFAFAPAAITVEEGDSITWTNQDTAPHTVTTTSGPERLNSPYLSKGQSWSYTFTAPGMYMYYCTVHPDMRAEVIVQAPAPATTTAAAPAPTHASQQQQQQHQQHQQTQTQNPPANASRGGTGAKPGSTANPHAATASSAPPTSSPQASAAAGGAAGPSSGSGDAGQSQSQQAADSSSIRTLSPVLLLGGLTTAVAVFCLLLVGSRATGARPDPAPASPSRDTNDDHDY